MTKEPELLQLMLVIATIAILGAVALADYKDGDYCGGYKDGYSSGYCYEKYPCKFPPVIVCPIPRRREQGYRDGYNRGFTEGMVQGKKDRGENASQGSAGF